jgi:hypothetical protein
MLNRPLIGHGRQFESPQEVARACADLLDLHPHVLGSTLQGTGRTLAGDITDHESRNASRFCAVGFIKRVATGAPSFFAEPDEVMTTNTSYMHASKLLVHLISIGRGAGDLGGWFEAVRPSAEQFAALLRGAADALDLPEERQEEAFAKLRDGVAPARVMHADACPEQLRAMTINEDEYGRTAARSYLNRLRKAIEYA